ncbi:MAG TPA: PorV/PorQ family protein, partial [bacterium]|nr:PorV/PorQ family protein [bacterium]
PAVSAGDNAFLLSLAYRVKNIIAFGVTGKYILRDLAGYNASALGGDAGLLITPGDRFRVGLGVFNFGQEVQFISAGDPLPLAVRLGLAYELLDVPHHSLTLAVDNGWQFGSQTYTGAAGAEYWYDKTLALRVGYTGDAYQQHPTAGIGVNVDLLEFDYAFSPMGTLGDTHRFSLALRFGAEGGEGLMAPADFSARPLDGAISLHWKPVISQSILGYNLYVKKPNSESMVLVTAKKLLGPGESSVRLNRLVNGESYTFGISSVSPAGRESRVETLAAIPGAPAGAKAALPAPLLQSPTGFKAAPTAEGFNLTWDKAETSDVAGFYLYLGDSTGNPGKKLSPDLITNNQIVLKKVNPTKTYQFFLTAVNKSGVESAPAPLSANFTDLKKAMMTALLPPPAHFNLQVKDAKVYLSWDNAGAGKKYNVYVSHDGVKYKLLTKEGTVKTQAVLGPLKTGAAYYFGITTVTADGQESDKAVQSLPASTPTAQ